MNDTVSGQQAAALKASEKAGAQPAGHFDLLIAGAGISGIGSAYHLQQQCPGKTFVILETQERFGGTWSTHRYPGIRSDSDLYTFGYRFKPWMGAPIATAQEILKYLGEVIEENDLARHIRYRHRIDSANWDAAAKRWTVIATRLDSGERLAFTASFLWMCQGYYRHTEGYTPNWPHMDSFQGQIVHPQLWPDALDLSGKRVVVIGSGATAATLVPAIAGKCAHVTMLQRSPTYFVTGRNANILADQLRELDIDPMWIHEIVRRKILFDQAAITRRAFSDPEGLKKDLLAGVRAHLPEETVQAHFTPRYAPWRQRIAFIPDADLFRAIARGEASVATDEIERFLPQGLALKSGKVLEADVIVTATGFNMNAMGDIAFSIDGQPLDFADTVGWRGAMFTGVPNLAWVFGYFRASWTLRTDLIGDFVCRLLNHMAARGATVVTPKLRDIDRDMKLLPWVDPENFNPGYVNRSVHLLPRQGEREPWRHTQDYWSEKDTLPKVDLEDGTLQYE